MQVFLRTSRANYNDNIILINVYNDNSTILKPAPLNQRLKNQQRVLMFSDLLQSNVCPYNKEQEGCVLDDIKYIWRTI